MAPSGPEKYTSKLKGARVLVIGGSSGIGFGVAEGLLANEAFVIISSSSTERVAKAIARLESANPAAKGRVQGYACNLGSAETLEAEVEKLFSEVAKGGKLDHIVHTAGDSLAMGPIENFSLAQLQQAGMVRFFSPLIVAKYLRKHLKEGPASSFTMTTGGGNPRPPKNWPAIIPYLAGLEGINTSLAKDMAPIRVNLVGPGAVDTELWNAQREAGQWEGMKEMFKTGMATQQIGQVEDVVESYLYLMKDKNTTGSMIYSNGGALLM